MLRVCLSAAAVVLSGSVALADVKDDCANLSGDAGIAACTQVIAADPGNAEAYANRGGELREMGRFDLAVADYAKAVELAPANAAYRQQRALVLFDKGDFTTAAEEFKAALALREDAHDHLYRHLALRRSGVAAPAELEAYAARATSKDWPHPVVEMLLSRRTPAALIEAAGDTGSRCEAHFYIGQWHLIAGDRAAARQALETAVETCSSDFVEHASAVAELKRLPR